MKNQDVTSLRELTSGIGDFIRYWGFRKIHGQLWALIYLAKKPPSGAEMVELLGVSKALVSPALKQLATEGLIEEIESENDKVKRYAPVENVEAVIRRVLETRERKMMNQIQGSFEKIDEQHTAQFGEFVHSERLQSMGQMINTAQIALEFIIGSDGFWN